MKKPNPHNSPVNAYRVMSSWRNYPKGLINSQVGIISTYYPKKNTDKMPDKQVIAFSKRLYNQADKVWESLTTGEKEITKILTTIDREKLDSNQIQDLEERVAILLYQNETPEDSKVMPDIKKRLTI